MTDGKSVIPHMVTMKIIAVALTACCWRHQNIYICKSKLLLLLLFVPIAGTVWHTLHWSDYDPCEEAR